MARSTFNMTDISWKNRINSMGERNSDCNLQWTVTLTVAVAGVFTLLLALHWYWIMLSAVPGLLTLTTDSKEVWERSCDDPTFVHAITGAGFPDALHDNVILFPSWTEVMAGKTSTKGASETDYGQNNDKFFYAQFYML